MIYELLHEGEANAITGRELCELLNINMRQLTLAIESERRAGQPICAATGKTPGYYLAATREEMERYGMALHHRAGEIYKTRRACLKAAKNLPTGGGANE